MGGLVVAGDVEDVLAGDGGEKESAEALAILIVKIRGRLEEVADDVGRGRLAWEAGGVCEFEQCGTWNALINFPKDAAGWRRLAVGVHGGNERSEQHQRG